MDLRNESGEGERQSHTESFFAVFFSAYIYNFDLSLYLYPNNTQILITEIPVIETLDEATEIADQILEYNESLYQVYYIKSLEAYSTGSINSYLEYKSKEIELAKYNLDSSIITSEHLYMWVPPLAC